jgi:hypothetical protein
MRLGIFWFSSNKDPIVYVHIISLYSLSIYVHFSMCIHIVCTYAYVCMLTFSVVMQLAFWQPFPPHPNYKKSFIYKNIFIVNHTILCGSLNKWVHMYVCTEIDFPCFHFRFQFHSNLIYVKRIWKIWALLKETLKSIPVFWKIDLIFNIASLSAKIHYSFSL